jgi:hypothetical protein
MNRKQLFALGEALTTNYKFSGLHLRQDENTISLTDPDGNWVELVLEPVRGRWYDLDLSLLSLRLPFSTNSIETWHGLRPEETVSPASVASVVRRYFERQHSSK